MNIYHLLKKWDGSLMSETGTDSLIELVWKWIDTQHESAPSQNRRLKPTVNRGISHAHTPSRSDESLLTVGFNLRCKMQGTRYTLHATQYPLYDYSNKHYTL